MEIKTAVEALGALAQETRLAVFRLLVNAGPSGLAAGVIAGRVAVPPATLSFHLKELAHAGLITARRESRQIFYAADFAGMRGLLDFLTEDCCRGHPEVCAISPEQAEIEQAQTRQAQTGQAQTKQGGARP